MWRSGSTASEGLVLPSTVEAYAGRLQRHVLPRLADRRLDEIEVDEHDLRHTFASLLIAGGANITFVSRQLGHTSSQITLGVYAHLLDREEQARRTREMLQEVLGSII
jgi:integrase